jgi:hypothetical protein
MPCRFPLNSKSWPVLLQHGIESRGDSARFSQQPDDSDVHFFWGLKRRWGKQAMTNKKRCVIIERAYLGDRFLWLAFGFNDLNGYADFCNKDVPPDRWEKYWANQLQPWKPEKKELALVIGQKYGDASLRGTTAHDWARSAVKEARKHYKKVIYRHHPLERHRLRIPEVENSGLDLAADLARADVVVTFSSNTGVDAIMAGVPVIAYNKGSMVYDIAAHSFAEPLYRGDRNEWGRRIAYAQWLPQELKDGTAWAHLRKFV